MPHPKLSYFRLIAPLLLTLMLIGVFFAVVRAQVDPSASVGLTVVQADDTGITLLLDLSAHSAANEDLWDAGLTATPGMPQVPLFSVQEGVACEVS